MTAPVVVGPAVPDLATGLAGLAAAARRGTGPLVLLASDLHLHPEALADLAEDPRPGTAVLASRAPGPARDLRVRAGRVVGVPTAHPADACDTTFTGAVKVAAADRATAAEVADRLAGLAAELGWTGDPLLHLVRGLVRSGVRVGTVLVDPWPWARGDDPAAAAVQSQLDGMDAAAVHAARLRRAAKADDGFTATFLHRPLARRLTPLALRLGLTPNQVTLGSVVVGLGAAAAFALGGRGGLVAGALLLQVSLVVDCVDGDVARYRRMFSPLGAWLDASTDRLKEFACYGGLAWGAGGSRLAWTVAGAMLVLQTARHALDYTFTAVKELRESEVVVAPLDADADAELEAAGGARAARAVELSRRAASGRPAVVWAKKVLHLGIAERWTVLSLFALAGRPVVGLGALLVLGAGSLLYVVAGRALRTRAWPATEVGDREREIVAAQADLAPLVPDRLAARVAGGRGGHGRALWARPAALRVLEYVALLLLAARWPGRGPGGAVFLLLLVVASHHYDLLYRVLQGLRPAGRTSRVLGLGAPGRVLTVAVLAALGGTTGEGGLWVLATGLGILFVVVEPARVLREVRTRPDLSDPTGGAAGA